ncbi:MAG: DUF1573 domain-containing protein [Candidatus Symbiothrix sp.]|nr:DUF1573 domain-containing protein [Candidatus Symbiothrix sp.]
MLNKKLLKFALIIPALAGLCVMASVPNFSMQTDEKVLSDVKDEITIDKTVHDFGTVKEADGELNATFTITNKTKTPIVLTNVSASCGCTTPTWTKEPIAPGKTGTVAATYNPQGRQLGPFEKTITIFTSGTPERITAKIKGIAE